PLNPCVGGPSLSEGPSYQNPTEGSTRKGARRIVYSRGDDAACPLHFAAKSFRKWYSFVSWSNVAYIANTVCFRPACVNLDVPWPTVILIPERKPMTGRPL